MAKSLDLLGSPAAAVLAAALACSVAATPAAGAQPFPTKPIRIIVTSTPSSGPDIIARLIGQRFTEAWHQQIVVDNRAGAAGRIGAEIGWYGLVAPARTPPEILSQLNAEVVGALKTTEFQERVSALGAEPIGSAPEVLATFLRAQIEKLGKAVRESGARRD